jgi:hypothetical protein
MGRYGPSEPRMECSVTYFKADANPSVRNLPLQVADFALSQHLSTGQPHCTAMRPLSAAAAYIIPACSKHSAGGHANTHAQSCSDMGCSSPVASQLTEPRCLVTYRSKHLMDRGSGASPQQARHNSSLLPGAGDGVATINSQNKRLSQFPQSS